MARFGQKTKTPLAKEPITRSPAPKVFTLSVLTHKKQVRTGLYGIDTTEKGQVLKKEAKRSTSKIVFGKKSWW